MNNSEKNKEIEEFYKILADKLDATVMGLSKIGTQGNISDTWMEYLRVLVPKNDIKHIIHLPIIPGTMSVKKFAKKINLPEDKAMEILDRLVRNDCVMVIGSKRKMYGIHLPFMIFDAPPLSYDEIPPEKAKKLAELSLKYLVNEEWYRNFEGSRETPLTRIIPVQESIEREQNILSHEDVIEIVDEAKILALQKCACRSRLDFLGIRKCDHPLKSCISVDIGAKFFIDRGVAEEISKEKAKTLLKKFNKMGLVHTTENFREGSHNLICNCCSCCCSSISGITRWNNPRSTAAANFIANPKNPDDCTQCETCVQNCNFKAITIKNGPIIDKNKCLGCGICVVNCNNQVIELIRFERETIYENLIELSMKVAKETNKKINL